MSAWIARLAYWYRKLNQYAQQGLLVILVTGLWLGLSANSGGSPEPRPFFKSGSLERQSIASASMHDAAPMLMRTSAVQSKSMGNFSAENFIPTAQAQDEGTFDDRKLIRTGSLTLEVSAPEESRQAAEQILMKHQGFIENLNTWEVRPNVLAYNLSLRIPAENLDTAVQQLVLLGNKTSENFQVQDITENYRDNQGRIKNLESQRDRLRELLEFKTENLADVLKVERELSRVQTDLDRLLGTQKRYDKQVSYSLLQLTLQPEPQIGDVANPTWSAKKSWRTAVNQLLATLQSLTDQGIKIVVFAPLWGGLAAIAFLVWRVIQRRKKA